MDDAGASPTALPALAGLSPTSSTGQRQQPFRYGFEGEREKGLEKGGLIRAAGTAAPASSRSTGRADG
ncbi:MAG: hypothetical protein OXD36_17185, partial [Rhodobacter sp.]|nr:hypothetical protein [Rhodobacter sp.]